MPTDVMVLLQGATGLPRDKFVNTLHFEGDDWDAGKTDELWSKYQVWLNSKCGGLQAAGHEIRCYHQGLNASGPYFQKSYSTTSSLPNGGPAEVALCLSYATVDNPDASTPRRRGRIYLGPLSDTQVGATRPTDTLIAAALTLGEGIAQVGLAANVTWSMFSQRDNSYHKIESIWCDDSWDTQRRRGLGPTKITKRDVQ